MLRAVSVVRTEVRTLVPGRQGSVLDDVEYSVPTSATSGGVDWGAAGPADADCSAGDPFSRPGSLLVSLVGQFVVSRGQHLSVTSL